MTRRQRQRTERTRLAFLSAARTLFEQRGYVATTVREITKAAGRAHGTFYLYFDSKHDVFTALLAGMGETITHHARELWSDVPTLEAIWLGVRDFFDVAADNRDLWQLLQEMAAVDEATLALRSRLRTMFATRIQRGIEIEAHAEGRELDPAILAELLTAMVFNFACNGYLPDSPDVTALHVTVVWARGIGLPEADIERLTARVLASQSVDR